MATFVTLRDKNNEKVFTYINTHFDHVGRVARIESAKMIDIIYNTAHKSFLVEYGSAALGIVGCLDKAVSGETNVMTLLDGMTVAEQALNNYIAETKASLLGY